MEEQTLRRAIVEVGKLLYERKYIVATDGNISIRLDRKHVLITPAGFCKGLLSEADIVRLPLSSTSSSTSTLTSTCSSSSPAPSSETPFHLAAYLARPDTGAIIHAHPPCATSFAVSGRKLDAELIPETKLFDGPVGRVPFIKPGSDQLAQAVARALRTHRTCLLARHGAIAVGKDVLDAFFRLERLEFLAQVTLLSAGDTAISDVRSQIS
jgi:L-fuculose-phosphate aldolase